jgi:hypothetical protein
MFVYISGMPHCLFTKHTLLISFDDERGYDAGGLSREFYTLVFKDLFDPNKGLF